MTDRCFENLELNDSIGGVLRHPALTRAQAMAAGELVDVSLSATLASFRVPVAVTSTVWRSCVQYDAQAPATEERVWTVLFSAFGAIRKKARRTNRASFTVYVERDQSPLAIELLAVVEPGDRGEPVITIYLGSEH